LTHRGKDVPSQWPILLVERTDQRWDVFRRYLIHAIDDKPERPYWDSFATALDGFASELDPD
jgi:hypothetical protein